MIKKNLKKITDLTVNDLLNNEIIMPSVYFENFNKNAMSLNVDLKDNKFEDDLEKTITEEFSKIENYMNEIYVKTDKLTDSIKETKEAIKTQDITKLSKLYKEIHSLQNDIEKMKKEIYTDEVSKTYNRKWIYRKFLTDDLTFKKDGIAVLVNLLNFDYIEKEYGSLISDNLIVYIINKLKKELTNHNIKFKISRFTETQLLFFIDEENLEEINTIFYNVQSGLNNTTLKSQSGLLINTNITYFVKRYRENEESKDIFESLFIQQKSE